MVISSLFLDIVVYGKASGMHHTTGGINTLAVGLTELSETLDIMYTRVKRYNITGIYLQLTLEAMRAVGIQIEKSPDASKDERKEPVVLRDVEVSDTPGEDMDVAGVLPSIAVQDDPILRQIQESISRAALSGVDVAFPPDYTEVEDKIFSLSLT